MEFTHKSLRFTEPARSDGRIHKPTAKARSRDVFKGGRTWHYTPADTRDAENYIRNLWLQAYGKSAYSGAVRIEVLVWFPRPKSHFSSSFPVVLREDSAKFPTIKPDHDNLEKLASDALKGVAFLDDKQIVKSAFEKQYCDVPDALARWEITIWELENGHRS